MPDLREDPLTGDLVILAPERATRPSAFGSTPTLSLPATVPTCPFCPGNEHETPPEVHRTGSGTPDAPGWEIRTVPNRYPIVSAEPPGVTGAHEVVILSPAHDRDLARLGPARVIEIFGVLRDRAAHHTATGRRHAQVFVNQGTAAGASIEHPHAQLVALDLVPPAAAAEQDRFATGRDPVAAQLAAAPAAGLGVLGGPAPAWCPAAASWPFEVLVAHRSTRARFEDATDPEVGAVATSIRTVLGAYRALLGDAAYNVVVHTAPRDARPGYHWYVRLRPRLTVRAGFEEGTGVLVNIVDPESAAAALREVVDPVTRDQ